MNNALILGVSSHLGRALVRRLHEDGVWVRGADIRYSDEGPFECDDFFRTDLREPSSVGLVLGAHPMHEHWDAVFNVVTLKKDMTNVGDWTYIQINVLVGMVHHASRVSRLVIPLEGAGWTAPKLPREPVITRFVNIHGLDQAEAV